MRILKEMGYIARTLMTVELFAASVVLLGLAVLVSQKMTALCPDSSTNKDCKRPMLNGFLVAATVVGLLGGGLSAWKVYEKFGEVSNSVAQQQQ